MVLYKHIFYFTKYSFTYTYTFTFTFTFTKYTYIKYLLKSIKSILLLQSIVTYTYTFTFTKYTKVYFYKSMVLYKHIINFEQLLYLSFQLKSSKTNERK